MTVGELKRKLDGLPEETLVIIASDPEFNGAYQLHEVVKGYGFDDETDGDWPELPAWKGAKSFIILWPE